MAMHTILPFYRFHPLPAGRLTLVILAFILLVSGTPLRPADAPPAKSGDELITERAQLRKRYNALVSEGKMKAAIVAAGELIDVDRSFAIADAKGAVTEETKKAAFLERLSLINWLVVQHGKREEWSVAAARTGELADIFEATLGKAHYMAVSFRSGQVYVQKLASLKQEDARALAKADENSARISQLYSQGKYPEAISVAQESLKTRQTWLGIPSSKTAASLNDLAMLYQAHGDYAQAEPLHRQAVEIMKKVLGENHPDYASSLNNLADLYQAQGDYVRAEPLYREASEIRKKVLGENHPDYADSLNNSAMLYQAQGDYARAEPLLRQASEIRKKVLGENHPAYASNLDNLAVLYAAQGDYARAEPLHRQTLKIIKETFGENHPIYARGLNNLAVLYQAQGDYARAEPLYREASEIRKKVLGENHPDYADSLDNLAVLYAAQGDYARAEPLHRQALKVRKSTLGENHPHYAASLDNLADLYCNQGDYVRAEPLLRQALEIRKKALGENHPDYAASLSELSSLYYRQGHYARAEPLFRQALEIDKKVLGENHPHYAASLNNLAALYYTQGDYAHAEPLFRQAMEIIKKVLGENHPDYALGLNNLARLYRNQGDYARAEPLIHQAVEIIRRHIEATSIVQSERQQLAMLQANRRYLVDYVDLAADSGRFVAAAYRESLAWKGIVLRRNRLSRAGTQSPELLETFTQLQRVTTQLTRLAWATPNPKQEANWGERTAKLSAEKEQLEAELSARSAEYRQAKRRVTSEEVQTALPQDAVLIDFIEYWHHTHADKKAGTKEAWERGLLGFVLAPGRPVEMVPLGPIQPINVAIETWRATFGMSPDGAKAARFLRERLWVPFEGKLHGAQIVFLSPDGALSRLPFGALPGKTPGTYLIEERTFALVPVPQLIPELVQEEGRKQLQKNLLLMGDIDYDAEPSKTPASPTPSGNLPSSLPAGRLATFPRLPGTEREVVAIEKVYHEDVGGKGVTTLKKSQASKQAFLVEARRHSYLHLATHGFFIEEKLPSPSAVAARGASDFGELLGRPEAGNMYPAIFSGLALAGANRAGKTEIDPLSDNRDDNGILTAEEIGTQNLDGVQLVVLSACETGLGKSAGGEGVLGLQRSFQSAGARNVVASLWPVDDKATAALMTDFYTKLWKEQKSPIDALREAQLDIIRVYRKKASESAASRNMNLGKIQQPESMDSPSASPRLWAGFVLSGVGE